MSSLEERWDRFWGCFQGRGLWHFLDRELLLRHVQLVYGNRDLIYPVVLPEGRGYTIRVYTRMNADSPWDVCPILHAADGALLCPVEQPDGLQGYANWFASELEAWVTLLELSKYRKQNL